MAGWAYPTPPACPAQAPGCLIHEGLMGSPYRPILRLKTSGASWHHGETLETRQTPPLAQATQGVGWWWCDLRCHGSENSVMKMSRPPTSKEGCVKDIHHWVTTLLMATWYHHPASECEEDTSSKTFIPLLVVSSIIIYFWPGAIIWMSDCVGFPPPSYQFVCIWPFPVPVHIWATLGPRPAFSPC